MYGLNDYQDQFNMDPDQRSEYYGELLFDKLVTNKKFANYTSFFDRIIATLVVLDDDEIKQLLDNKKHFEEQVTQTIQNLSKEPKSKTHKKKKKK